MRARARHLLALFLLPGLSGCVATGDTVDGVSPCAAVDDLEAIAKAEALFVSAPRPVPGFPSLATNRVLAGFDPLLLDGQQRAAWLQRLEDAGARRDAIMRGALLRRGIEPSADADLSSCQAAQPESDVEPATTERWQTLAAATRVPDDYLGSRRALGLYPLATLPVRLGINGLQKDIADTFATPLDALPRTGTLQRFAPAASLPREQPALPATVYDALGLRLAAVPDARFTELFDRHAPVLEIDVAGAFDRPGVPAYDAEGQVTVDAFSPRAYRYARVMPLDGELRLQLVYVFWFAARPRRDAFDMLGGPLDGLVWRVTLDRSGEPLVYDAIHPCGCYHMLFPSDRLALRDAARDRPEPPLLPQAAPRLAPDERIVVRLESATHYLQRVYTDTATVPAGQRYAQRPYGELYSVASPQGPRSLFGPAGIVPGTQRGERFYLWPMGVRSPGAMRERGRQATAFIGRRHFDDARLLEDLFLLRQ